MCKLSAGAQSGTFALDDVARHCTPQDCWVIVHGKVYDVTNYIPRHPGGTMIYVKAGGDCSQLFDSYHTTPKARAVLEKFRIGEIESVSTLPRYERQGDGDKLYEELKHAVNEYFHENKLDPRYSVSMYIKTALILSVLMLSASVAFFTSNCYLVALAAAIVLGVSMAEVGISIQHDANHGAFSRNTLLCHTAGLTLDAVGASSFMWKQQHVVGHHAFTNVESEDPDIRVKSDGSDVRRVTSTQPLAGHHRWQHLYLGALYSLLALKSIFVDDFAALASRSIGPVKVSKFSTHEAMSFWGGKALFMAWFIIAPLALSQWGLHQLLGLWAVALAFCGWTLAFMFQVAHVVEEVDFLQKDSEGVIQGSWAEKQIRTSADFCHGSFFWTHFSGGLNYQIVHHLFPGVIHTHYPALAPIVQKIAQKHGLPYTVFPTFYSAFTSHFNHLKSTGAQVEIPSMHTIG